MSRLASLNASPNFFGFARWQPPPNSATKMRPRRLACLLTGAAAILFVIHGQFRPEFTERKISKPKPEANRYQHGHPKPLAFAEPPAPAAALEVASASAAQTHGALGVEAYTGGSPYDCTPSRVDRGTRALDLIAAPEAPWPSKLTRTSRSLRTARKGYAHWPPACSYRRHRAAWP